MTNNHPVHSTQNETQKAINHRRYGFILAFFAAIILSVLFFFAESYAIGVCLIFIAILQILIFAFVPKYYIFSKEALIIKYSFNFEEEIKWQYVRSITGELEKPGRYFYLDSYKLYYYPKEKQPFFMQGTVIKNKKTKALMEKYCPKKID